MTPSGKGGCALPRKLAETRRHRGGAVSPPEPGGVGRVEEAGAEERRERGAREARRDDEAVDCLQLRHAGRHHYMTVATPSAPAAPVLLLTAGNGPWAWSRTRYELVDAALDETVTTYPLSEINAHPRLGHVMRSQTGEHVTFDFGDTPLELHLGATHEEAGVGSQLWDASVALSLFLRPSRSWVCAARSARPPALRCSKSAAWMR